MIEFGIFLGFLLLATAGYMAFRWSRRDVPAAPLPNGNQLTQDAENKVSYARPEFEWSGVSIGTLPLKTLTYNQYECLEDARYGFRIVGLKPTERHQPQPHKTRGHSAKTVASLSKHGFLSIDLSGGYIITDLGLNALETCSVRY